MYNKTIKNLKKLYIPIRTNCFNNCVLYQKYKLIDFKIIYIFKKRTILMY